MKKLIRRIFAVLTKKEKSRFRKLAFLDVLISFLDIAFIVLLLILIDFYSKSGKAAQYPGFAGNIAVHYPLVPVLLFFVLFSIKNFIAFIVTKKQFAFIYDIAARISASQLSAFLSGSYTNYIYVDSSAYFRSIGQQPLEFSIYVLKSAQQIISQAALVLLTVIPIIIYNAVLFPLLLVVLVPPLALAGIIMKKRMNTVRLSINSAGELSGRHLKEAIHSFVESNIYDKKDFFAERYNSNRAKEYIYHAEHQILQNLPSRLIEVFAVFGLFILIAISTYIKGSEGLSIITISAFMAAAYKIIPGIVKILTGVGQIRTYWFTATGLAEVNDEPVTSIPPASAPVESAEFRNVHFNYWEEKVLVDFSFSAKKGELTGIAGLSGRGKSTVLHLLLGFLSGESGEILINGKPVSAAECRSYWPGISYIKQESFLFHGSILQNITLQNEGYDEEKLNEIMKATGTDELVRKGHHGIHTVITEEGKNLSGGQRQRIILARALYKDFSTLILDEPFNELDEESEKKLTMLLKKTAEEGKLVILITHSRETLSLCHKKIVME